MGEEENGRMGEERKNYVINYIFNYIFNYVIN